MQDYKKQAQSYPLIGSLVYWAIKDFRIPFQEFLARMDKAGIPTDLAKEVSAKSALIAAIKTENKGKKNKFHRKLVDEKSQAAFAVVNQAVDTAHLNVDFQKETTVILDKENKSIRIDGFNSDEIKNKFENILQTYSADQFRNVILRYLSRDAAAVSIRDRGGVYFVPETHKDQLQKLVNFFELFPECAIEIIPIADMAQAKKSMWRALVGEVEYEMEILREEIGKMDPSTSDKVIQRRVEKVKELSDKVSMYESLLQGTADTLNTSLKDIQGMLKDKLTKGE